MRDILRLEHYLLLTLAFISGFYLSTKFIIDADLGWQLLGGQWIIDNQQIPYDEFINYHNKFWHNYHWLGQVIFFIAYRYLDFIGLNILLSVLAGTTNYFLVLYLIKAYPKLNTLLIFLAVALNYICTFLFWTVRTQIFSFTLIAISIYLLQSKNKYSIYLLYLFAVILTNIHVYWIIIPFLWFLSELLPTYSIKKQNEKIIAWGQFLFLLSAGLVSPYGIFSSANNYYLQNYAVIWDYLISDWRYRKVVPELSSGLLAFSTPTPYLIFALASLLIFSVFKSNVKPRRTHLLLASAALILPICSIRFTPLAGIFSLPLLAQFLNFIDFSKRQRTLLNSAIFTTGIIVLLLWTYHKTLSSNQLREALSLHFPLTICSELPLAKPTNPNKIIIILTDFNSGGWCRWGIYQKSKDSNYRISSDSRSNWLPADFVFSLNSIYNGTITGLKNLKTIDPEYVLTNKHQMLTNILLRDTQSWEIKADDSRRIIFHRVR